MEKPEWWDDKAQPAWVIAVLKRDYYSRMLTIKDELTLRGYLLRYMSSVIIEEPVNKPASAWAYHAPVWVRPRRVYIKLKLARQLVAEGKLQPYKTENQLDRVWTFYSYQP